MAVVWIGFSVSKLQLHYSDEKKYSVWLSYFHPFEVSFKVTKVYKVKRSRGFLLQVVWVAGLRGQQCGLLQLLLCTAAGWRHCSLLIGSETLLPGSHMILDISLSSTYRLNIFAWWITMCLGTPTCMYDEKYSNCDHKINFRDKKFGDIYFSVINSLSTNYRPKF